MDASEQGQRASWLIPGAIFAFGAILYALLSSLTELPVVTPDEFLYGGLARSVGQGEGVAWYGVDVSLTTRLYVYLLAPAWAIASNTEAYGLAKVIGAVTVCTVVFPVWVLARRLTPDAWHAAVPAGLAIAGTWMISAGGLLSENLAYPLCTAALTSTVLALREPGRRWIWIAIAFAALATLARAQMIVLFPIILSALAIDVLLAEDPRQRLARNRVPAALLGVAVLGGAAAVLSGSASVLGVYADVSDFSPSFGDVASAVGEQWVGLAIACGVLPLAALLALGAQKSAWRDADLGPLLCVAAPAVAWLLLQTGYFNAGAAEGGVEWAIERYVQYAIPLLLVVLFVGLDRRRLPIRWLAAATAAVALTLLATTDVTQVSEERARFTATDLTGLDPWLALPLIALVVGGLAVLIIARLPHGRVIAAVGGVLLVVFALQSQSIWRWQVDLTQQIRAQYPDSMEWVNDNADGPVSRMYLFQNSALFQVAELFNDDVEQNLGPSVDIPGRKPLGTLCTWTASARGVVQPSEGCRPMRRTIWNDDPIVIMSFHGGKVIARDPKLGQLIAVPAQPRLRSMIQNPCQRSTLVLGDDGSPAGIPRDVPCTPTMAVNLWLDRPGILELTYRGGLQQQRVSLGTRTWTLAPGRKTTIRVPLNEPAPQLGFNMDWTARQGTPKLVGAALVTDGRRESLL